METKLTKESINSNNTIVNFNSRACTVEKKANWRLRVKG